MMSCHDHMSSYEVNHQDLVAAMDNAFSANRKPLRAGSSEKVVNDVDDPMAESAEDSEKVSLTSISTGQETECAAISEVKVQHAPYERLGDDADGDDDDEKPAAASFVELFSSETSRLMEHITAQQQSNAVYAQALLADIDISVASTISPENRQKLEEQLPQRAEDLARAYLELDRFVGTNTTILKQVAMQADDQLGTSCAIALDESLGPFKCYPNCSQIPVLSDIYRGLRAGKDKLRTHDTALDADDDEDAEVEWVAPSSFVRSTAKYWIEDDKLSSVLQAAVAVAPLLVYGSNGRLTSPTDSLDSSTTDELWDRLATPISSIYFDSQDHVLYRERLARREEAQLLRARWYGKQPSGVDLVFLELKTHHEQWVNSDSVKERVSVQEKDMKWLLSTDKAWNEQGAEEIVRAASPSLADSELQKASDLLITMRGLVVKHKLRPCVRLTYKRAAFQSPKTNSVRLTVDRFVFATDESNAPAGAWCLPDGASIDAASIKRIPFAVFEVKLAGSMVPESIQALIDSEVVTDAAKFSKFLTGVAAFRSHELSVLPYWATHPSFAPILNIGELESKGQVESSSKCTDATECILLPIDPAQEPRNSILRRSRYYSGRRGGRKQKIAPKKPARVEPKSFFANERTFIQWISAALLLVTIAVILLEMRSEEYARKCCKVMVSTAVIVVGYATFVYFRRVRMLRSGQAYGYVDHFGPVLLSAAVLGGVSILLYHIFSLTTSQLGESGGNVEPSAFLREEEGMCYKHSSFGLSPLSFEPSDALVDASRSILLVPSKAEIVAFQLPNITKGLIGDSGSAPKRLIDIPGADLEALAVHGDTIFAVDEDMLTSTLYALKWTDTEELRIASQWTVPAGGSEGAAFVTTGQSGLYLADNKIPGNEKIMVFDIPEEFGVSLVVNELEPHHTLNTRMLRRGLKDTSKIGAMTWFEDVLYVLYGNARVVRAWDLEAGVMLSEWKLPFVKDGADKQWEGLALEHIEPSGSIQRVRSLHHPKEMIVHLTLDTPLEVWSFLVQEGETRGSVVFPNCAAV